MLSATLNRFSAISWLLAINGLLVVTYIALIATVMSYAALQVEFAQSVRGDEAALSSLETEYLSKVREVTATDYHAKGYEKPSAKIFVSQTGLTAFNSR